MEHGKQGYPLGQIFETQYYSQCAACKAEINPGERVFYMNQEELVHAKCPRFLTKDLPVDGATAPASPTPDTD